MPTYPPLKAIVAFDAAMRAGSFLHAAELLAVTPGAISQQVRKLEEWLGVALFVRSIREIHPTAEALAYWKEIQPALAQIAGASQRLKDSRSQVVALSMPPSFAAKWFPQRMARLLTRHPKLELRLNASSALVDFEREPIDLAIRYFGGDDPALEASLLFADEARVYCNPGYAARHRLRRPDDLVRVTLLDTTMHPHWPAWFRTRSRISDAQAAALPRMQFDQGLIAIETAKRGQGVVLTSPRLIEDDLASGALVEPFPSNLPLSSGYYVVHPRRWPLRPAAVAVRDWLIEETRLARDA
jgi:LysR family transcriptional regulator, glycine cleavage system transcriptional activator